MRLDLPELQDAVNLFNRAVSAPDDSRATMIAEMVNWEKDGIDIRVGGIRFAPEDPKKVIEAAQALAKDPVHQSLEAATAQSGRAYERFVEVLTQKYEQAEIGSVGDTLIGNKYVKLPEVELKALTALNRNYLHADAALTNYQEAVLSTKGLSDHDIKCGELVLHRTAPKPEEPPQAVDKKIAIEAESRGR